MWTQLCWHNFATERGNKQPPRPEKTKPRISLFWHISHYYIYPKGPADILCCHGYSNSVTAAQRKLQPWDLRQLHLRVNVTKWHFSSLPLMCDKIQEQWQKWGPGGTLKKKKIHATKHFWVKGSISIHEPKWHRERGGHPSVSCQREWQ